MNTFVELLLLGLYFLLISKQTLAQKSNLRTSGTIIDDPHCAEVTHLCRDVIQLDDMLILECLYSLDPNMLSKLNDDCQNVIWNHTASLTDNGNVKDALLQTCTDDLSTLRCSVDSAPGSYLKCILSNKEEIKNVNCLSLIERLENIAFYDYKWTGSFLDQCKDHIIKLNCGRLDQNGLSQSNTLECLQDHIKEIPDSCRREIFQLVEIQADNIKFDHQLYLACRDDHMRYCRQFAPGSGRIFKCLMQHREDRLTTRCHNHLLKRQKFIAQDYKISKGLMRACREDISKSHCRKQSSDLRSIHLAQILLCLENIIRNGTKIDPDCEAEIVEHRKMLMEDYRLSPEILDGCSKEITSYCKGVEFGGKTIHCLMDHARLRYKGKRIGDVCLRAVSYLKIFLIILI